MFGKKNMFLQYVSSAGTVKSYSINPKMKVSWRSHNFGTNGTGNVNVSEPSKINLIEVYNPVFIIIDIVL